MRVPSENVKIHVRVRPDVPGVRATYFDVDERLWCGVKDRFSVSLIYEGRSESWSRGRTFSSGPGTVDLKQPNQVHRDLRRDGSSRFQIVSFDDRIVDEAARLRGVRSARVLRRSQLDMRDPDLPFFDRLHSALRATRIDLLPLQTVVAEGLAAFTRQLEGAVEDQRPRAPRPKVARAVDYIHAHLTDAITLDALAERTGRGCWAGPLPSLPGVSRGHGASPVRICRGATPRASPWAPRARNRGRGGRGAARLLRSEPTEPSLPPVDRSVPERLRARRRCTEASLAAFPE